MPIPPYTHFLQNRIRVYPAESVTTIAKNEVPPASTGLSRRAADVIWSSVKDYYKLGLQPAMSLCIRRNGKIILNRSIGHSRGNGPGDRGESPVPARPDSLFNLFSATKCVTSMLIHLLAQRKALSLDDRVCEFIPAFERHNKGTITIRHLLSHQAGIPFNLPGDLTPKTIKSFDETLDLICDYQPVHGPGAQQAYHPINTGFLLQAIAEKVTGTTLSDFLHQEITVPLGLRHFRYGLPRSALGEVATDSYSGPRASGISGRLIKRATGVHFEKLIELANSEEFLTGIIPSANIITTAEELSSFFELLLRKGRVGDSQIFTEKTITRAVAEHRQFRWDHTLMLPVRYGLGFMLGGEWLGFYGPGMPRAFGHLGFTNIIAYADPERDITVAFLNNGKPLIAAEFIMWMRVMWKIGAVIPRDYGGKTNPGPAWR